MNWIKFNPDDKSTWPKEGTEVVTWVPTYRSCLVGAVHMYRGVLHILVDDEWHYIGSHWATVSPPAHKDEVSSPTHISVPRELSSVDWASVDTWLQDFADGHRDCEHFWRRIIAHFEAKEASE